MRGGVEFHTGGSEAFNGNGYVLNRMHFELFLTFNLRSWAVLLSAHRSGACPPSTCLSPRRPSPQASPWSREGDREHHKGFDEGPSFERTRVRIHSGRGERS